jgi:hypothetical protein
MSNLVLDVGNQCVWCQEDTAFGSGRFVDRIPVSTYPEAVSWMLDEDKDLYELVEGYGCTECYGDVNE